MRSKMLLRCMFAKGIRTTSPVPSATTTVCSRTLTGAASYSVNSDKRTLPPSLSLQTETDVCSWRSGC